MASEDLSFEQEQEVERLLGLANIQRMRGQYLEAEDTCRKALTIAPKSLSIREMLGDILHESGKLDEALGEYKAILKVMRDDPSAETKFAKVALEIGDREREKAIVREMIENPHKYTARERNPIMALLWSVIVPGLGQLYNGDVIKAAIIFGTFVLFFISYALLQQRYPGNVQNFQVFLLLTSPVVLVLGILALIAYIYGVVDAPIMADKSNKAAKKHAEP